MEATSTSPSLGKVLLIGVVTGLVTAIAGVALLQLLDTDMTSTVIGGVTGGVAGTVASVVSQRKKVT